MFSVYSLIDSRIDELDSRIENLELKGYAHDICFLLTRTQGYPTNWETGSVSDPDYVGLFNSSTKELQQEKISKLNPSLYKQILDNMGVNGFLRIEIVGLESLTTYKDFGAVNLDILSIYENYVCYSNYNNEPVKVIVGVWK